MAEEIEIFTLKQVVSSIKKTIEERYARLYWVKAEMHKLNQYPSGHCFPELLQKEDGKIVAEMRGTIWKQQFEKINARFVQVAKEPLKEDTTLLMQVRISFHETYGLSLQILDIDPNYTLGELQRERQETLKRLQKEGLINKNQQLEFPLLPKRIAVISADSSKGLSDFKKVLEKNEWGYRFFTMLFPAYLQGDMAATSINQQLRQIEKVKHHFDVVVIVRGGGGEVGLSCYNNYELCRSIATFPLPILTGIGHSTNLTVAEMTSYSNAITPTELGEFFIQAFHNFSVPVKESMQRLKIFSKQFFEKSHAEFDKVATGIGYVTRNRLLTTKRDLAELGHQLKINTTKSLGKTQHNLQSEQYKIMNNARVLLSDHRGDLRSIVGQLPRAYDNRLEREKAMLEKLEQSIRLMDPTNVLKRGYSITTIHGKTISMDNTVDVGDIIQTQTAEFEITSIVKDKKDSKRN